MDTMVKWHKVRDTIHVFLQFYVFCNMKGSFSTVRMKVILR